MGSKAALGLLTILAAGMSSIGASEASDHPSEKKQSSAKKEGAKNYDEMVVIPAGNSSSASWFNQGISLLPLRSTSTKLPTNSSPGSIWITNMAKAETITR